MKKAISMLLVLALLCFACAAGADTGITLENIREYVVGLDEPMELRDGTSRPITPRNCTTIPARK